MHAERAFLAASIDQEEHDALEREAQRQRELEAARELAESQNARLEEQKLAATRLRWRAVYLTGALLLTILLAVAAIYFGEVAYRSALTAQANFTRSEAQRLGAEASSLTLSAADPQLIALLSLRSINTQYTVEGDAALTGATALPLPQRIITGHSKGVYSVVFSPDDKYVLTGSYDGTARLIDAQTGQELRQFTANGTGRGVRAIFSPDGQSIFAASNDGTVWKWDVNTGEVQIPSRLRRCADRYRSLAGWQALDHRKLRWNSAVVGCTDRGDDMPVYRPHSPGVGDGFFTGWQIRCLWRNWTRQPDYG